MLEMYSAPLSESENQKCKNAISMVRDALKSIGYAETDKGIHRLFDDTFAYAVEMKTSGGTRRVKIFLQGSYANNTNVRTESDVDVAVIQEEVFRTKYRTTGSYIQNDQLYHFSVAEKRTVSFKDEVQKALIDKFGRDVERKNKSIKVHGNTYRKDADVVPCIRHRDYTIDYKNDANNYIPGISILTDDGKTIIKYPEQHIENGRKKNKSTNMHYKKMVRVIKKMRYLMEDYGHSSAEKVNSFMLESVLWNIPDDFFLEYGQYRKVYLFKNIIEYLVQHTNEFMGYKEANGIKPLCESEQNRIALVDFVNDLSAFYEYE